MSKFERKHHRRKRLLHPFKRFYLRTTGYSYTNMGRLFLRLFVGFMLFQFGLRQINDAASLMPDFPEVWGIPSDVSFTLMVSIELICAVFIMCGFLTRIICIPPFIAMLAAEYYLLSQHVQLAPYELSWQQPGYLPIMFMGIFFFIILVGPGKLSVDYVLSLYIIQKENCNEDAELEQM